MTIDAYVHNSLLRRVGLTRLEVEGTEAAALHGGRGTISETRPLVVEANFETSAAFGYEPAEIVRWFRDLSHSRFVLPGRNWTPASHSDDLKQGDKVLFVRDSDGATLERIGAGLGT